MRGKVATSIIWGIYERITPASAGKSKTFKLGIFSFEDHPRECGEKICETALSLFTPGSPPRVRGKANVTAITGDNKRITPASAGKSNSDIWLGQKKVGSPPRVRGKESSAIIHGTSLRITPASAGKSLYHYLLLSL